VEWKQTELPIQIADGPFEEIVVSFLKKIFLGVFTGKTARFSFTPFVRVVK
jgi:hypothetical protein